MRQTGSENAQTHQFTTLIEQIPNSHNQFTRKCVVAREVNCQSDFGNERVDLRRKEKTSNRTSNEFKMLQTSYSVQS